MPADKHIGGRWVSAPVAQQRKLSAPCGPRACAEILSELTQLLGYQAAAEAYALPASKRPREWPRGFNSRSEAGFHERSSTSTLYRHQTGTQLDQASVEFAVEPPIQGLVCAGRGSRASDSIN